MARFGFAAWLLLVLQAHASSGQISDQASRNPEFEVATIKPVDPQPKDGRFFKMEGVNRFVAKNYTLKLLIAAAYDLNPKAIQGGAAWVDASKFDINAVTPGTVRPTRDEQMAMLRGLLMDRFQLTFHREQKEFSIYVLTLAKDGPKLKESGGSPHDPTSVISTVYPDHILMPARNASMKDFTAVLQRAVLDRPVVDKTGLTGRYDFDLDWAQSEREFGGEIEAAPPNATSPPFVTALEQELGLKLAATHGLAEVLLVDKAEKPSAN